MGTLAASYSRLGRAARIATWALRIVLAFAMIGAGLAKLSGAAPMVQLFDFIGIGQWFRFVTGAIEVLGGIGLLTPFAGVAALALTGVLAGAALTEVVLVQSHPERTVVPPIVLLAIATAVAYLRRDELRERFHALTSGR